MQLCLRDAPQAYTGEIDAQMLTLLQSPFPAVPITADIVEGSSQLTEYFKMRTLENYERHIKEKGHLKTFDFIHMIQVPQNFFLISFLENLAGTIKFYRSLLKNNGQFMIIVLAANSGWGTLWKTYKKDLCVDAIQEYRSSGDVSACLKSQGLKYEEHEIPNTFDITDRKSPEIRAGINAVTLDAVTSSLIWEGRMIDQSMVQWSIPGPELALNRVRLAGAHLSELLCVPSEVIHLLASIINFLVKGLVEGDYKQDSKDFMCL
ncbi:hypothetical protein FQN60_001518, partial [Etheostoma spectabile]